MDVPSAPPSMFTKARVPGLKGNKRWFIRFSPEFLAYAGELWQIELLDAPTAIGVEHENGYSSHSAEEHHYWDIVSRDLLKVPHLITSESVMFIEYIKLPRKVKQLEPVVPVPMNVATEASTAVFSGDLFYPELPGFPDTEST